jgi:hypothetical protein
MRFPVTFDGKHHDLDRLADRLVARAHRLPDDHPERQILLVGARFLQRLARRLKERR